MFFFYTFSPLFPHYFYTFFLSFSFFCNTYFSSTIFLVTNSKTFVGVTLSVVFLTPFMADNYADEKRCFLDCFGVFLQRKKRKEIIEVHCFNDVVFLVFFFTFNFFLRGCLCYYFQTICGELVIHVVGENIVKTEKVKMLFVIS